MTPDIIRQLKSLGIDPDKHGVTIGMSAAERLGSQRLHAEVDRHCEQVTKKWSLIRKIKSKTELLYADELERQRINGEIIKWRYEAIRWQLADHNELQRTYTPDFVCWLTGGKLRCIEVKHWREQESDQDTRTVLAWARQQYAGPLLEFRAFRMVREGGWIEIWQDAKGSSK